MRLTEIIQRIEAASEPRVELLTPIQRTGGRLGILAASFNPVTIAHVELIHRSSEAFALDETLALAGITNADKSGYECSLEDRVAMLQMAFADDSRVSIGLSSHAFYVDMIEALERVCNPRPDLHFVVGFDTFERVLDFDDRYTQRYHRSFSHRTEALEYLLSRSRLIVAARAGAGLEEVRTLLEREPAEISQRILYMDFPSDLGELSATEVRARVAKGLPITGLVPEPVERHISQRGLYQAAI
ncbi:MAG: nicotinate-nicotinamide nucleotide adenylyltransferase [Blastocatellia bacterium]